MKNWWIGKLMNLEIDELKSWWNYKLIKFENINWLKLKIYEITIWQNVIQWQDNEIAYCQNSKLPK